MSKQRARYETARQVLNAGTRRYLSFGGGVNSTALMLWLLDQGIDFEAVYADHGCDWPETRAYVAMLTERSLQTREADQTPCRSQ